MTSSKPFLIYNASAGSGKTFTLVKNYLLLLYGSNNLLTFRNILALTFTNKAVTEMKSRIIETLQQFSEDSILDSNNVMFSIICEELNVEPDKLHQKSKRLLETIVHNYAAFDISTIDKFNHKLIRVFAHDLKLPINFEVELDTQSVLARAVDKLIDRAGSNKELTKILVDFAIEKADDNRSWDIGFDFNAIAQLLVNENEMPYLETIKDKTLDDFLKLKKKLQSKLELLETMITETALAVLDIIDKSGLEFSDFSYKTLPNHFKKAAELNFTGLYNNRLEDNIKERKGIYSKSLIPSKKDAIESLIPQFETAYLNIKQAVFTAKIYKNALKNITPLSVLNAIRQSLAEIKEDEDILLISEFNGIINSEIKTQPAPFIYERIGEKFKHYFIDEFQDTSVLQWENLVPLVSNALSGENLKGETGSLMLVGDAKQAIYRWRGGRAEQFIDLYSGENPFFMSPDMHHLPANFRSFEEIVNFNNGFFNHISEFFLSNEKHVDLYRNSTQDIKFEEKGFVNLDFLDIENGQKDKAYCETVFESISKIKSNGYHLSDICIIVRKKKEGIAIAEFLTEKGVPIISSETLMINHSPQVQFLDNLLALNIHPNNNEAKVNVLIFLAENQLQVDDIHLFLAKFTALKGKAFFEALKTYGYDFSMEEFLHLPIYEAIESAIRTFKLVEKSNAYVQFFLDEVLDYSQKKEASLRGLLEYWNSKKERLSIVSPLGKEAVQIMTIHKSKGLEFPVVIFPYANQDLYFDLQPKIWFPVAKKEFCGFPNLYLNLNKDLEEFSELGKLTYLDYRSNLELDTINLLYVVLTRAAEQLYVISELDLDKDQQEKTNFYSGLFISYLKKIGLWDNSLLNYQFGTPGKLSEETKTENLSIETDTFISTSKEDHHLNIITNAGLLWDSRQIRAIERGNLVHDIMAKIELKEDVNAAFEHFINLGKLNGKQYEQLLADVNSILTHPLLNVYFNTKDIVLNERDIIAKSGQILRPDRLVINTKNQAVIIDYKTGLPNPKHKEQLFEYQNVLEQMNLETIKKFLVYINDDIVVKEF